MTMNEIWKIKEYIKLIILFVISYQRQITNQ